MYWQELPKLLRINISLVLLFSHEAMSKYFATQWIVVCQAPLSMEFSRHECWSGLPFSSPGDLPDAGIESIFPALAGVTMFMRERKREKAFTISVVIVVQLLSPVWQFATLQTAAQHVPLSPTFSERLFTLLSIETVVPSDHRIRCCHFPFCLQCWPAWESFSMSWLFASVGQSIGVSASASIPPMNIQDWFPLGWTG